MQTGVVVDHLPINKICFSTIPNLRNHERSLSIQSYTFTKNIRMMGPAVCEISCWQTDALKLTYSLTDATEGMIPSRFNNQIQRERNRKRGSSVSHSQLWPVFATRLPKWSCHTHAHRTRSRWAFTSVIKHHGMPLQVTGFKSGPLKYSLYYIFSFIRRQWQGMGNEWELLSTYAVHHSCELVINLCVIT